MTLEERVVKLISETEISYRNDELIKKCIEFSARMERMGLINRSVYPSVTPSRLNELQTCNVLMPAYTTVNILLK